MEVYILDSLLRREQVVDWFESLIWTERWSEIGDFELRLPSTLVSRSQFVTGRLLAMNESYRVMMVETVEDTTDEDGQHILRAKGSSLESMMMHRVAKNSQDPIAQNMDNYGFAGTPASIVKNVFLSFFADGLLSEQDKMPFLKRGTLLPVPNIPPPAFEVWFNREIGTLYEFVKAVCETYELGFRLVRNFDNSELYFEAYTGNDLTTKQTTLKPIIFSPGLDNLQNTSELNTIEDSKNVAYVYNEQASVTVYSDGASAYSSGFDRRVLLVKADEAPENMNVGLHLQQRGLEELAKHRRSSIFDGEINQNSMYKYGVDYNLGDLVEMRDNENDTTIRRVTEQIFVSDQEGERSYPTLSEPGKAS